MNDEPDIRTIDAHAERYGGDDDVDLLFEECVLVPVTLLSSNPACGRARTPESLSHAASASTSRRDVQ